MEIQTHRLESSAPPEHLGRELTEVEVVPPGGDEPTMDFDDSHHRQGDCCAVVSREVIDSLGHHNRALSHHVDDVDIHMSTHTHELIKGGHDGGASRDGLKRNAVKDGVLVEKRPDRKSVV